MIKKILFILLALIQLVFAQNQITLDACTAFRKTVMQEFLVKDAFIKVPLVYASNTDKRTMNVYYWVKKGVDSTQPPLLLIHGGPGGNSWRYYQSFKMSPYKGDIVSIDNRNEGCSHVKAYDDVPAQYDVFRARSVVEDLERLRKNLYPNSQWRVFGQSRGVAIAHYYLEMYPNSLESVQSQGYAMMTQANTENYTYLRSHFNARGSERFSQQFPEAVDVIKKAKDYFTKHNVCLPMNLGMMNLPVDKQPRVCGGVITDSISYKLSNWAKWNVINNDLLTLRLADGTLDEAAAAKMFQNEINGNIYVQYMNYIMGTNGMDVGSPAPRNFDAIKNDRDLQKALISEGRFVAEAVYPAYLSMGYPQFLGYADPFDFKKVKDFLMNYEIQNGKKFKLTLFSSFFDTIAAPEMYNDEKQLLGRFVDIRSLAKSGHEGWSTEPDVMQELLR